MRQARHLIPLTAALCLIACSSATMQQLPSQEPGKAVVIAYSSTLNATSSFNFYINDNAVGDIQGDKVKVVYLTPGNYNMKVTSSTLKMALNKPLTIQSGKYYFLDAYATSTRNNNSRQTTTYHLDEINQNVAMDYLQGPTKFTGWTDLASNTLNGKRIW